MRIDLRQKSSAEIMEWFEKNASEKQERIEAEVLESDIERIGYKAFTDLSQIFFMKMLTPHVSGQSVILRFEKLNQDSSFHKTDRGDEKYGVESEFFSIDKTAQFSFLYYYQQALRFINIKEKKRILNLGINKGDEFKVIKEMLDDENFDAKEFIGIDYSDSVIRYASKELPHANCSFISHDINTLDALDLGEFDLIISIGTLQSSNINFNATFMYLYQKYLAEGGAVILGFPNCRWIDGEMIYGAKAPNYSFSEMSLVLKDIHFCKKYLQQKKYRVTVTGKDYLFLTARKISL
ncbi:class I SAM-dependent methyltransferase [bacterium]|nr:class I SAM-dependent methyltransferase [bacterium]MBU1989337.1 class I SAM-dependent methyltransferase [bacterium]